jgi:SagB-type dehydrogenase family enzyme
MLKPITVSSCLLLFTQLMLLSTIHAETKKPVKLPGPQTDGGKPFMQTLNQRRSSREYSTDKMPMQTLSNLLWASSGISSSDGKRTAPSARNIQEIDVYVASADGLFLYDAKSNSLVPVLDKDIRSDTGKQPFVSQAAINLIFVADYAKMQNMDKETQDFYAAIDTGYISQNVYLFCSSENLATVVRGMVDKPALAKKMILRKDQKVMVCQTVGYHKK